MPFHTVLRAVLRGLGSVGLVACMALSACGGGSNNSFGDVAAGSPTPPSAQSQLPLPVLAKAPAPFYRSFTDTEPFRPQEKSERASSVGLPEPPTSFTGHGWYWNPLEPGTGVFVEAQGDRAFVGVFLYDTAGDPIWHVAEGTLVQSGRNYVFDGMLKTYRGGQALDSVRWTQPTGSDVGPLKIRFVGGNTISNYGALFSGVVELPGGRFMPIRRFPIDETSKPAVDLTTNRSSETGWFWDPSAGGRGWAIEAQGDKAFMVIYHYDAATGAPRWSLVRGSWGSTPDAGWRSGAFAGRLETYRGGQQLAGAHRAPIQSLSSVTYQVAARDACAMRVTYPGQNPVSLVKFRFANIATGAECRTQYYVSLDQPDLGSLAQDTTTDALMGSWELAQGLAGALFYATVDSSRNLNFYSQQGTDPEVRGEFLLDRGAEAWQTAMYERTPWLNTVPPRHPRMFSSTSAYGSGSFVAKSSFWGALTNEALLPNEPVTAEFSADYSANNARAVALRSFGGGWESESGFSIYINETGEVLGSASLRSIGGPCVITGRLTQDGPALANFARVRLDFSSPPGSTDCQWAAGSPWVGAAVLTRDGRGPFENGMSLGNGVAFSDGLMLISGSHVGFGGYHLGYLSFNRQ